MKWVRLTEGAFYLNTTTSNLMVTASQFRKRHDKYPVWYKAENNKAYVDIEHIQKLREHEEVMRREACDLYFYIIEDMGIIQAELARILVRKSAIFTKQTSWLTFFQGSLFCSFQLKFNDRETRLKEFYRIAKDIVDEHNAKLAIAS
jgi:hypothetical protein